MFTLGNKDVQTPARIYLFCAAVIPVFGFADALAAGRFVPEALAIRLIWSSLLFMAGCRAIKAGRVEQKTLLVATAMVSGVALVAIPMFAGGPKTYLFASNLTVPLGVAALLRDDWRRVAVVWVTTAFASVGALAYAKVPANDLALWSVLFVLNGIACLGLCYWHAKIREAERAVQSQLEESEHRRTRGERLAMAGQLAASVAHEISNPMQAIVLQVALLASRKDLPADIAKRVKVIESSVLHVRQIVQEFKTHAKDESNDLEEVCAAELVEDALRLARVRLETVADVETDIPAQLPQVKVHRRQMCQALLNLLMNAADALEPARLNGALVRLSAREHGNRVCIEVEDNGPGIAEDVIQRLFEPFFTTKREGGGTGLGLTVSREIIERFGGTLKPQNVEPHGARFVVELPISRHSPTVNLSTRVESYRAPTSDLRRIS
jgi:signal transduction histidine kinase